MKKTEQDQLEEQLALNWKQQILRSSFFNLITKGLIVTLPIIIILFLVSIMFSLIFKVLAPISIILDPAPGEPHWSINLLSLAVLITIFYLIGRMITSDSNRRYLQYIEKNYLVHVPLYVPIRDLVRQFSGAQAMPFSRVVLVDPFNSGVLMTGFVSESIAGDIYTVFVPTAPNPTNGNIYHVPANKLTFVDVDPESALRTVVGMGTGSACLFNKSDAEQLLDVPIKIDSAPKKLDIPHSKGKINKGA